MSLTRKQREIAQRHDLFLEISSNILAEEGFHMLTMERIAELAEYSKGTVYQHFTCKEEILIQLCVRCMSQLQTFFNHAIEFDGTHRDRMLAIFYANDIWSRTNNNSVDLLQHLSMHGVKEKVTEESLNKHDCLEKDIIGAVTKVVIQAIEAGELPKNKHLNPAQIVFGLWSLCSGGQLLQSSEIPLEEFGVERPDETLIRSAAMMLDGLGWQPLYTEAQFKKLLCRFEAELFVDELKELNNAN